MSKNFNYNKVVYDKKTDFPNTGDVDTIYIDASQNKAFRYDVDYFEIGSAEVDIWGALGDVSKKGGGAAWGGITGTLSNQTDLNTALSAKQDTLTLTTTGSSGAATLVGRTLNIPQYSGGGGVNPSVIVLNATDGTAVTGTLVETISRSLLIPANTFASSGMLEILGRINKTGTLGAQSFRIYKNTSNTLTGATLIGLVLSASTAIFVQGIRTYRISSNTLTGFPTSSAVQSDYNTNGNAEFSTTFTTSVDNYILLAITLVQPADSSVVRMARAVKYI
jgi:hypothetical protein